MKTGLIKIIACLLMASLATIGGPSASVLAEPVEQAAATGEPASEVVTEPASEAAGERPDDAAGEDDREAAGEQVRDDPADELSQDTSDERAIVELSVPPSDLVRRESPLPNWALAEPSVVDGVLLLPVRPSVMTDSQESSWELLRIEASGALEAHLETFLGSAEAARFVMPDEAWIDERIDPHQRFTSKVWVGSDEKYESAALLRLTRQDQAWLADRWQAELATARVRHLLVSLVVIVAVGFVVLATAARWVRRLERRHLIA